MRPAAIALAIIAAALAAWWFLAPQPVRNYPSQGTDIIALGDSLVYGTGAGKDQGFVALLAKQLGQPIINLGKPGDTTADVLARLGELDKFKPKVVLLLVGGNDYLKRVDRADTFANLGTIVANIQARGAIVLLLGVRGGVLVDNFDTGYERVRDTYQTAYVPDVLDGLLGNRELMSDQVHPNAAGYAKIAERVYPELAKLLK